MKLLTTLLVTVAVALCVPAFAKKDDQPGKGKPEKSEVHGKAVDVDKKADKDKKGKSEHADKDKRTFSEKDREAIIDYYRKIVYGETGDVTEAKGKGKKGKMPPGLAKHGGLPPGLAKKDTLPPGWADRAEPGEKLPEEVLKEAIPLPKELKDLLPPLPEEVETVVVDGKVVRLAKATNEILDIFEVDM